MSLLAAVEVRRHRKRWRAVRCLASPDQSTPPDALALTLRDARSPGSRVPASRHLPVAQASIPTRHGANLEKNHAHQAKDKWRRFGGTSGRVAGSRGAQRADNIIFRVFSRHRHTAAPAVPRLFAGFHATFSVMRPAKSWLTGSGGSRITAAIEASTASCRRITVQPAMAPAIANEMTSSAKARDEDSSSVTPR
jgi:hypothetical protein